jgi:hypothetical protein
VPSERCSIVEQSIEYYVVSSKVIFSIGAKFCKEAKDGYGLESRLKYAAARH